MTCSCKDYEVNFDYRAVYCAHTRIPSEACSKGKLLTPHETAMWTPNPITRAKNMFSLQCCSTILSNENDTPAFNSRGNYWWLKYPFHTGNSIIYIINFPATLECIGFKHHELVANLCLMRLMPNIMRRMVVEKTAKTFTRWYLSAFSKTVNIHVVKIVLCRFTQKRTSVLAAALKPI